MKIFNKNRVYRLLFGTPKIVEVKYGRIVADTYTAILYTGRIKVPFSPARKDEMAQFISKFLNKTETVFSELVEEVRGGGLEKEIEAMIIEAEHSASWEQKANFLVWKGDYSLFGNIHTHNSTPEEHFDCFEGRGWDSFVDSE